MYDYDSPTKRPDSDMSEYIPMTRDGKRAMPHRSAKWRLIRVLTLALVFGVGLLMGRHYPMVLSVYSRRPPMSPSILPHSLTPRPSNLTLPLPSLPPPLDPVPNIVHYIHGLDTRNDTEPQDFPYFAYLAMRSALIMLKPERIMFHCVRVPRGYWWDRVLNWEGWIDENGVRRGMIEVVGARKVEHIGKGRRPVLHFAHRADIIRLEVLHKYGGVYLDIDTVIVKPFDSASLYQYDTVLGMEAKMLEYRNGRASDDEMAPKGLCNAVIISRPGAVFLERWMAAYEDFDGTIWSKQSVEVPWVLAQLYPTTVTVLSERAFFWPLWTEDHIRSVYETIEYDFDASGQLAYHAWETLAGPYLRVLNPSTISRIDTSFTRLVKRYREPGEEARWRHSQAQGVDEMIIAGRRVSIER